MTSREERGRERTVGDEELEGLRESEAGDVVVDEVVGVADGVVFLGSGEGGERGSGVERGGCVDGVVDCTGDGIIDGIVDGIIIVVIVTIIIAIDGDIFDIAINNAAFTLLILLSYHDHFTLHLLFLLLSLLHHHVHQRRHVNQRRTRTRLLHRCLLRTQRAVDCPIVQHLPRIPLRVDERMVLVVVVVRMRQRVQLRQRQVTRRVHQRRMSLRYRRTRVHARSHRRRRLLVAVLQKQKQLHLVGLREKHTLAIQRRPSCRSRASRTGRSSAGCACESPSAGCGGP